MDSSTDPVVASGLDRILPRVSRPSRYIGGEWNEVVKDHRDVELTFALAYPDVYEIGMSHLGFRILYSLLNGRSDTAAERVFCPWPDMADALRRERRPLATLETQTPLATFDVVGFSLQYEMTCSNVLEMLDLAGIPLRSAERSENDPVVIAGGPVVFNVEPLADFLDLVFVGDGEEAIPEFLELWKRLRRERVPRAARLRECAQIEGVYVPSLYRTETDATTGLEIAVATDGAPYPVRRRILYDLDRFPFPDRILVPHGEIVHDRVSVEIMRGCPVGCRFCQAGYVYRPTRERDPNSLRDTVIRSVRGTGYDQFSLSSLNTGEYGAIHPLMYDLMDRFEPERVSISLSSMHASTITPELAREVRRVRKSGFTIAPEAGTQRMRDVVNKNLTEEQILTACRLAFEAGWEHIKLYFMIGLPSETDADVDGLVDLAHAIRDVGRRARGGRRGRGKGKEVTLSASSFVPKAETPFQWLGMDRVENLHRKQDRIAARVRRGVHFKHHDCSTSFLEAVFSRGDRSLGRVIERAWRAGARFDGWDEHFRGDVWREAFAAERIDPELYAYTDFDPRGRLPWDVVDSRVNRKWLALELKRSMTAATLSVCGPTDCHGCAPFARDCVSGVVSETTDRPFHASLPVLSTPAAPGPGLPACAPQAPPLLPRAEAPLASATERPRQRYRARFTKGGRMVFLGHLDLYRLLMRGLRRAGISLVYSQGFNPKPRLACGPALPVGVSSEAECVDFETYDRLDLEGACERINAVMPPGVRFVDVTEVPRDVPALSESVCAARYRVSGAPGIDVPGAVLAYRGRPPAIVERRQQDGKLARFDLAREVLDLSVVGENAMRLTVAVRQNGASVRAEEVVRAVVGDDRAETCALVREELLVDWGGRLVDPLLAASAAAARAPLS